jgi:transposase
MDLEAIKIAELTGISRNSLNKILSALRRRLAEICEDEYYFGAKRVRGKRGRGAGSKTVVFGVLKRHGKVYTEIVPVCSRKTL